MVLHKISLKIACKLAIKIETVSCPCNTRDCFNIFISNTTATVEMVQYMQFSPSGSYVKTIERNSIQFSPERRSMQFSLSGSDVKTTECRSVQFSQSGSYAKTTECRSVHLSSERRSVQFSPSRSDVKTTECRSVQY